MTNSESVVEEIYWEELWHGQFDFAYRGGGERWQCKIADSQVYNQVLKHLPGPRFVFIKYKILQEIER